MKHILYSIKMYPWHYVLWIFICTTLILIYNHKSEGQGIPAPAQHGTASWYSAESCQREGTSGVWTASGERYNENDMTCAMRRRDWGKYYRVTNTANGKSIIVRHNDFGPNKKLSRDGRIIDLSRGAFAEIAKLTDGLVEVRVERVK